MRRVGPVAVLTSVALLALLILPATASAVLTNEYGMTYAGQAVCTSCHDVTYGDTTHGDFAQVGADPSDDSMWPAGKPSVGEMLEKSDIGFTLGAGTGLREYLAKATAQTVSVTFNNVEGTDRYKTAVEASKKAFTTATTVVLATGENFPDALGGSALAGAVNGPILLTKKDSVPSEVSAEITRLGATKIYILGGESVVSAAVASSFTGKTVVRLAGTNRYATAALVASETVSKLSGFSGKVFVATGENYPDAVAASPIAFKKGMPIVLVNPATGAYTLPTGATSAVILGSGSVVATAVATSLESSPTSLTVTRLAGNDRYDTAAKIAAYGKSVGMSFNGFGVATGQGFADALSGGPLLGSKNAVMLLTPKLTLSSFCSGAITANKAGVTSMYFLGGAPAIDGAVRTVIRGLLPDTVTPATNPFFVPSLEWDPAEPDVWEIGSTGIEPETYTCQPCHHLGSVSAGKKPTVGTFVSTSTTATANAWATDPSPDATTAIPAKYVAGSSIQCEVCHGTGQAGAGVANHFSTFTGNVKIIRGTALLDSQVCGQCHGTPKSKSMFGYTPDQNINLFATWNPLTDVPTETSFTANPAGYKFFPNGQNKGNKHSYFSEWTLSGHSYRGALTSVSPNASVYQKAGNGHYNAKTSDLKCANCHTGEGYGKRKGLDLMRNITPDSNTVGYYGQECATCHMPHKAGTDNGMGIRAAETATTQAGIKETSICEDCHNWQMEVMGETATSAPYPKAKLTDRGGFSHPTREVYNGRGMFEVANADKFMPGVKCEECHMPATKSDFPDKTGLGRYENQSWKRYSHRMFIMEPGKAADWNLAAWGDSCSPCHAGQTQDELQGFIEKWQDEAADAATEASAAYVAAYAAAPSGEGTGSAGFIALMGRAYYNYRNYTGEGSMGAHNPPYIVEGLNKATQMAKSVNGDFDLVVSGTVGGSGYVMGTVVNGDGTGAANAKVVIDYTTAVDQVVYTDANGNFSAVFLATDSIVDLTWKRCSDTAADVVYTMP